jgi:hypothetical protein
MVYLWSYSSALVGVGLHFLVVARTGDAFVIQRRVPVVTSASAAAVYSACKAPSFLKALPEALRLFDAGCAIRSSQLLLTEATGDNELLQDAFQDSISWTDGPVRTLGLAFVAVVLLLVGYKALIESMDSAIVQVVTATEVVLKRYHPQRWAKIEEELQGLTGDDRISKLIDITDRMEEQEPELWSQVKGQLDREMIATFERNDKAKDSN